MSGRDPAPRASLWSRTPSWPRRSETSTTGKLAKAPSVRIPQRSSVSNISGDEKRTVSGRSRSRFASEPLLRTVIPPKPRAAQTAATLHRVQVYGVEHLPGPGVRKLQLPAIWRRHRVYVSPNGPAFLTFPAMRRERSAEGLGAVSLRNRY